eukprot:3941223-Rhodomonas_salina.5
MSSTALTLAYRATLRDVQRDTNTLPLQRRGTDACDAAVTIKAGYGVATDTCTPCTVCGGRNQVSSAISLRYQPTHALRSVQYSRSVQCYPPTRCADGTQYEARRCTRDADTLCQRYCPTRALPDVRY